MTVSVATLATAPTAQTLMNAQWIPICVMLKGHVLTWKGRTPVSVTPDMKQAATDSLVSTLTSVPLALIIALPMLTAAIL